MSCAPELFMYHHFVMKVYSMYAMTPMAVMIALFRII
jgi:hypothetical protein